MYFFIKTCLLCGRKIRNIDVICDACYKRMLRESLYENHPIHCENCGMPLLGLGFSCPRCRSFLDDTEIFPCYSFSRYEGAMKRLVWYYKFHGVKRLSSVFTHMFEMMLEEFDKDSLAIIPVPCSQSSKKRRGWDQMEMISDELKLRGFHVFDAIRRIDSNVELKKLSRIERKNIIDRIYNLDKKIDKSPEIHTLIIIDDVITTCATLRYIRGLLDSVYQVQIIGMSIVMD